MGSEAIKLNTIEDGGNPRNQRSIDQIDINTFKVTPFIEDNDPNYKFRLEVCATNNSDQFQQVGLQIYWNEPIFNKYRTTLYHRSEANGNWASVLMKNTGASTIGSLLLPPGKSLIASQPSYSYEDNLRFLKNLRSYNHISQECIGETAQKRKIHQIVFNGNPAKRKKRSIVVVCRIHPYETAGSYCAEGIVNAFAHGNSTAINKLDNTRIHLIPMANPDGVYGGFCKLTSRAGVDLSKQVDLKDSSCSVLVNYLKYIRPAIYCEIHNWMLPDADGIYFLNRFQAWCLTRRLPRELFKKWKVDYNKKIFAASPIGLKKFCKDTFNSTAFVMELPWFGRSTSVMNEIGAHSLDAMLCL